VCRVLLFVIECWGSKSLQNRQSRDDVTCTRGYLFSNGGVTLANIRSVSSDDWTGNHVLQCPGYKEIRGEATRSKEKQGEAMSSIRKIEAKEKQEEARRSKENKGGDTCTALDPYRARARVCVCVFSLLVSPLSFFSSPLSCSPAPRLRFYFGIYTSGATGIALPGPSPSQYFLVKKRISTYACDTCAN
jgi:hypothetical protein